MFVPIITGEVSPDVESWYQLEYYDLPSGLLPWMVSFFEYDEPSVAFHCFDFAQELSKRCHFGHYQNLYLVRRDGTYQCLRTNAPDERMRTIVPFGIRDLASIYQLRTAGGCRG